MDVGGCVRRACLCVLCGLPAAGKSTLARNLGGVATERGWRVVAVCYDDLIPSSALHVKVLEEGEGSHRAQTEWKSHRQAVLRRVEEFLKNPRTSADPSASCLINGNAWRRCTRGLLQSSASTDSSQTDHPPILILLDDNFYYPSMRYEAYQLAKKCLLGYCQVYLQCPVESCIRRNQSRPEPLPDEVISEMAKRLEPPNPQKNSWEKNSIELNCTNGLLEQEIQRLLELISFALSNPLSPVEDHTEQKEADRLKCANNVIHQTDQACRRLVSEAMKHAREKEVPPEHMRTLATELNESKSRFLTNLRKRFLQDLLIHQEEDIDVKHVVKTALEAFNRDKKEILSRVFIDE
ncbi:L-seryl-tRNA(Sec) kinase [Lampris incognitus]|uniref:L-seryl-tRNA(Sec) kinase n=1 Tax=Lampris incognitus TaxID=2546036 RepID=UPI0024B4DA84|nr:L-seryl-tRNA(Sec) kinase [Lampris incognitus]